MTHHEESRAKAKVHRTRRLGLAIAGTCAILVAQGCSNVSQNHFTVGSVNQTYDQRHPIELGAKEQVLDLPVAPGTYALTEASASAVSGFARAFRKASSGKLTIMLPSQSENAAAASSLRDDIVDVIENAGVPVNRVSTVSYYAGEHGPSAPIRLSFNALEASVGECGNWDDDLGNHSDNKNFTNFGCASQKNFAAMLANPGDLLVPRGMSAPDAERRSTVIGDYREGRDTTSDSNIGDKPQSVFDAQ